MKTDATIDIDDIIKPPRLIPGMEKALPDYSDRLARRTGVIESVVAERYDEKFRPTMDGQSN